jgi:hypothetical protein
MESPLEDGKEDQMTSNPGVFGEPEPDEAAADVLGGPESASDELGGPEPAEGATDLLGGPEPATDELGGPEPDEEGTDLLDGPSPV